MLDEHRWPELLEVSARSFVGALEDRNLAGARSWAVVSLALLSAELEGDPRVRATLDELEEAVAGGEAGPPCATCGRPINLSDPFCARSRTYCSRRCRARRWRDTSP